MQAEQQSRLSGWNASHNKYACADGTAVAPAQSFFERPRVPRPGDGPISERNSRNGVAYRKDGGRLRATLFVSEAELSRDMARIAKGPEKIKTVVFPKTVATVQDGAFACKSLKSVVLNEGLLQLGEDGGKQSHRADGCFKESQIRQITIPSTLVVLGEQTFYSCRKLRYVTFREGSRLERIGEECFGFSEVQEIELPRTVKEIGDDAFSYCSNLRAIFAEDDCIDSVRKQLGDHAVVSKQWPKHVKATTVGNSRLEDLRSLKSVAIPEGLENIGNYWFVFAEIESAEVPASVTRIGEGAFYQCRKLKSVAFANDSKLRTIERLSFARSGLEEVTVPSSVTAMESYAFSHCGSLKKVAFQEDSRLQKIGDSCFRCSGLEEFAAPSELREIGESVFADCESLRRAVLNEGLEELKSGGFFGIFWGSGVEEVTLPSTLNQIDEYAFDECDTLKKICISGDRVTNIFQFEIPIFAKIGPPAETMAGGARVWDLRGLREVVIPEGVERIGNYWFYNSLVENVTMPSGVKEIGFLAFCCCKKLKDVTLPDGLEEIGVSAFQESGLESVAIPQSARTIRQGAFCKCRSLRTAVLNEGLETLGTDEYPEKDKAWCGVFEESAVENIRLPSTLRRIEYHVFKGCENLKQLAFPVGLEKIGFGAFFESGLESAEFPVSLRTISQCAFACCKSLKTAKFSEGLEALGTNDNRKLGGVFEGSALESVLLPQTLKRIEYRAFKGCKNLKNIVLPRGLEYVGSMCFTNTGIVEITLPGTLKKICECVFEDCDSLRTVWVEEGCKIDVSKLLENSVEVRRK